MLKRQGAGSPPLAPQRPCLSPPVGGCQRELRQSSGARRLRHTLYQAARMKSIPIWKLAVYTLGVTSLLLLAASRNGLNYAQRRMLLAQPLEAVDLSNNALVGAAFGGKAVRLPAVNSTAYQQAWKLCKGLPAGAPPLPKLKRAAAWDGEDQSRAGNTTVVTTVHVNRVRLLEAHCAIWPHTIQAAVYVPLDSTERVSCPEEALSGMEGQRRQSGGWLSWLGLGGSTQCPLEGMSLNKVKDMVRAVQKKAQQTGVCNLQLELWTEAVNDAQLGSTAALMPQAALQNRALMALQPEEADEYHSVVLLDADIASVDVWQMVNWPSRWARALEQMEQGRVLVLPAFQLTPGLHATQHAAMTAAMKLLTAEVPKWPMADMYWKGQVQVYQDNGFGNSQQAAMTQLWFEAGDLHAEQDNGYPVLPAKGFAPFVMMLQQYVPWADERLRGSYYMRSWQALAMRSMGLQHIVQPHSFTLQLPHDEAYSRAESAVHNVLMAQPVFRQLVNEAAAGRYVPVTSFSKQCVLPQKASNE